MIRLRYIVAPIKVTIGKGSTGEQNEGQVGGVGIALKAWKQDTLCHNTDVVGLLMQHLKSTATKGTAKVGWSFTSCLNQLAF